MAMKAHPGQKFSVPAGRKIAANKNSKVPEPKNTSFLTRPAGGVVGFCNLTGDCHRARALPTRVYGQTRQTKNILCTPKFYGEINER